MRVSPEHLFFQSVSCVASLSDLFVILPSFSSSLSMCCFFFYLYYFIGASVSPCWQRGTTVPGIESSSQAFGWRSTSQMKRMLVLLKVAAVPVDAFAVTLGVIYNPLLTTRFLFIHVFVFVFFPTVL